MTAIAEKYARAIGSSHLEWKIEPGAIDMLTACGLLRDDFGVGMFRLRAEYDRISCMPGARNMRENLTSAKAVRGKLLRLAEKHAQGQIDQQDVIGIVDQILDVWIDPTCPTCTGRGVVGGYGAPQLICTDCGGSMKREFFHEERLKSFVRALCREVEFILDETGREIWQLLR